MESSLTDILNEKDGQVYQIAPEASIFEAAQFMKLNRVGALLVMKGGQGDQLIGVLSERDIVTKVVAEGVDSKQAKVHQVMSKDLVVIKPCISIREAMKVVTEKRVRHLPVVSEGKLLGVISNGDLTRRIILEDQGTIGTLYDYIYGSYPG